MEEARQLKGLTGAEHARLHEDEEHPAQTDGREPDHRHAHHGAASEGDGEGADQAFAGGGGGADVGAGGHPHTEETREAGADRAGDEGRRHEHVGVLSASVQGSQEHCDSDDEQPEDLVLAAEEGHRAFADVTRDLSHLVGAGFLLADPLRGDERVDQGEHPGGRYEVGKCFGGHVRRGYVLRPQ